MFNATTPKSINILPTLSILIFSLLTTAFASSPQCYSPSGSLSPSAHPCNPSAPASMCCDPGQTCLSNGLCETPQSSGNATLARGSCTDKSWKTLECLWLCLDEKSGDAPLMSCGTVNGSSTYCCNTDGTSACCGNSSNVFKLDSSAVQTPINASSPITSSATTEAHTTSHSFTGTSTAPPFSTASTVQSTPSPLPTPTGPTPSALSPSPTPPQTTSSQTTPNHSAAAPSPTPATTTLLLILLLTTIPLTLSLLSLLIYTLLRRRRARAHIVCLERQNQLLRWKTAKIEVVMGEEGEGVMRGREGGGGEGERGTEEEWDAGIGPRQGEGGYEEEVVREREDVLGTAVGGLGIAFSTTGSAQVGDGVRGYEYVVSGQEEEGRVERREMENERGLRGYGYVTDVGARWF